MNDNPSATNVDWDRFQATLAAHLTAMDRLVRPPADSGRAEWMRDWMSEGLSPEEWAARHAQDLASFSCGEFRYADRLLDAWVQRLNAILFIREGVAACRLHYLTPDEMRAVLERETEPF